MRRAAIAMVVLGLTALVGCGTTGSSAVSTASTAEPTSTAPTTAAPTTAPPTTAPPTTVPPTTAAPPTTAPPPACDGNALFLAAAAKEHFDPHDPNYIPEDPAGAHDPFCVDGWALAVVSRPAVGTTDGLTLFHATGGEWSEVENIGGDGQDYCALVANLGVPAATAKALVIGIGETVPTTCIAG